MIHIISSTDSVRLQVYINEDKKVLIIHHIFKRLQLNFSVIFCFQQARAKAFK